MMEPFSDRATLRRASEWFVLLRGADAAEHQADFDQWLGASEAHRRAYQQIEAAFSLGEHTAAPIEVGADARPNAVQSPVIKRTAAAVMSVGAMAAVMLGIMHWKTESIAPKSSLVANKTSFATPVGKIEAVRLSDNSLVTLDTETSLREVFSTSRRDVWLDKGRARFDVAHERRPFVVHVANGTVTAHGTVFDIRVEHGKATVRLLRGAIDIDLAAMHSGQQNHRRLSPGQVVAFDRGSGVIGMGLALSAQVSQTNWPESILDVEQISVSDLLIEANRYSTTHIEVATPDIASLRISGRFRVGNPDRLAGNLAELLGLEVQRSTASRILLRRPAGKGLEQEEKRAS